MADGDTAGGQAPTQLRGKTALITGGTRGIGRGIALSMAAAGAYVIISGRDEANAQSAVADIREAGGRADYLVADLFDETAVDTLVPRTISEFGGLDVLVNNAGIDADAPARAYPLSSWKRVMFMNLEVPFRLCMAAGDHFFERGGGAIVNIASVLGSVATMEAVAYTSAKHGLLGLTKNLAIEWARHGIRVNAVAPGLIQTDMTKGLWESPAGDGYVASRIPAGRIGQPKDIGAAVVFLASDAADFIHGESITVDGGFLAT